MALSHQELTSLDEMLALYDIYQPCMYRPDREKYHQMAQSWLQNDSIRVFVCSLQKNPVGILVLYLLKPLKAEILGIAVAPRARNHGIATDGHPVTRYLCTSDAVQCVSGGAAPPFSPPKADSSPHEMNSTPAESHFSALKPPT